MLILTRRKGEAIVIELPDGQRVSIEVQDVCGRQVRLGTETPDEMRLTRGDTGFRITNSSPTTSL